MFGFFLMTVRGCGFELVGRYGGLGSGRDKRNHNRNTLYGKKSIFSKNVSVFNNVLLEGVG